MTSVEVFRTTAVDLLAQAVRVGGPLLQRLGKGAHTRLGYRMDAPVTDHVVTENP
jgi:hypothetical protein